MLYVSRYVGQLEYGIVDTDDGKEDILTAEAIYNALQCLCDKDIAGVTVIRKFGSSEIVFLDQITPYQPPELKSQIQAKYELIHGIKTVVYKDVLASITLPKFDGSIATLRVSDIASCLGDYVFCSHLADYEVGHRLTLVLDDKVTLTKHSFGLAMELGFIGLKGIGVVIDVREVTRKDTLELVYTLMLDEEGADIKSIIDFPERRRAMEKRIGLL